MSTYNVALEIESIMSVLNRTPVDSEKNLTVFKYKEFLF